MGKEKIVVLHVDTEMSWRGGQQQAIYLFESMLKNNYKNMFICQPSSALEKYCLENNLPYRSLKFSDELDIYAGYQLSRIAKKYGASILQLHSGHSVSWGLWAKLFNPSLFLVATRRVDFSIRKNFFSILKYNNRFINKIVCISDAIRKVLIKDGISDDKLTIIKSSIDSSKFHNISRNPNFRRQWGIPDTALLIGTVAAFVGHKDYPNFMETAKLVCDDNDDVYFMAVGDGVLLKSMKALTTQLGIDKRIIFTGFQKSVPDFLIEFDMFVLSSKMEGLGTSVLDALAVGLPVVATQAGGIPEMITHGENGFLVPIKDAKALAQGILTLVNDEEMRLRFSKNAAQIVSIHQIDEMYHKYISLYEETTHA